MVDVLILNFNDATTTLGLAHQLCNYDSIRRILIVDNCSTDDSYKKLKENEERKIMVIQTPKNGGYGYGNNFGLRYLYSHNPCQFVMQCNPDIIVSNEVIMSLEEFLIKHSDYAMVAPFMLNARGIRQKNTAFSIPEKFEYILSLDLILSKGTDWIYLPELPIY